jgi:hypothetical protein
MRVVGISTKLPAGCDIRAGLPDPHPGSEGNQQNPGVIKNMPEPISMPWLSMAFDCLRPRVRQRGAILPPGIADISANRGLESQKAPQAVVQAGTLDHGRDKALHVPN